MSYRFSARTGWDVGESGFAAAIREARAAGRRLIDLTVSNPTVCGFEYDAEAILAPLASVDALKYDPDPRGMRVARAAVAGYYGDHGADVDPDAVVLTTSTSEGYGYLFRLLCDAGDEVLVAQPSYPLFDFLADLEDVRLRTYPLFYEHGGDGGWWIDFAELEKRIGPRTKAIVVVHPNNPTGHATGAVERERLEEICARHGLALIVDEVFLDYPLGETRLRSFAVGPHPVLTFCLSGMSKIAGLPQMKVGWVVGLGPEGVLREAMGRLEVIADTFLSMNAPVQGALASWLAGRRGIQEQILGRVRGNLAAAQRIGVGSGVEALHAEAGWSAVLRLPQIGWDGRVAEMLLREAGVVVHPGSFYGIAESGRVVVSLLGFEQEFGEGLECIVHGLKLNHGD
ncbi:MAG TPA: pyridoxal phosphate-dependent aminotransferase [Edaphobacter sp.]|nr:pyridoxal phosphate-dependent aminotransferase [Edaphobacter sp.]